MKKITNLFTICACCLSLFAVSCKKSSSDNSTTTEDVAEAKVHSDDAVNFDGESDAVDDDVDNTVASSAKFCGAFIFNNGINHIPFDVDTTNAVNSTSRIILTFNGNIAPGQCRKRTGTITIDLLNAPKWVETNAVLRYTFTNFKVQDVCKGKSITLNGERYVTNVSGGNLVRLKLGGINSLVHKIRNGANGLSVTFTDSSSSKTAVWNAARKTEIKFDSLSNGFYYTVNGDSTLNGIQYTASWGNTRNGKAYTTVINNAIKSNTVCKLWRPTVGLTTHTVGNFSFTTLFGLDANGSAVTSGCATHYKVSWQIGGGGSNIIAYK